MTRIFTSIVLQIIDNIVNSFVEIISENKNSFNREIKDIEYIPKDELNKIINEFNENTFQYDDHKLYHVEFSNTAKQNPDKIAIICNNINITYNEIK